MSGAAGGALALLTVVSWVGAAESPEQYRQLTLDQLMAIDVTTATRAPQARTSSPSAVQVVTGEEIRRSGATTIPEALRLASNLHVAQIDARQWAISARGFNSLLANKLLVMIDGRTVYSPLFAGVFWDVQDTLLADIDRVEVVSGPGATLWSGAAVNGVVNVVTRPADQTQGLFATAGAGTETTGFAALRWGGRIGDDLAWRVYGQTRHQDDAERADGADADDGMSLHQGGFRGDWTPAAATTVTLQGDAYTGDIDQRAQDDIGVSGHNLLGRWTQAVGAGSEVQFQTYWDRTHRDIPGAIVEDLDTVDVDLQHRFPLVGRQTVIWGLGWRRYADSVTNSPAQAFIPGDIDRDQYGGFLQDEIVLVPATWTVTLGSKLERNEYTGWEVQPSGRVAWWPDPDHLVWSAVSRAVRTPSRIDREWFVPGDTGSVVAGGAGFHSEELWAYELGWRGEPGPWAWLGATAFFHDYDEIRSAEQAAPPAAFPVVVSNGLRGHVYGVELVADIQVTTWSRVHLGWTGQRVEIRATPGSTDATDGSGESHDPRHIAALRWALDLPARLECDLMGRWVARIDNQDLPSYAELDVRLGWQPRRGLHLAVVGRNLLHDRHAEHGAPGQRVFLERSILGTAAWSF